jgi:diacylglycerol kinase (ATP)
MPRAFVIGRKRKGRPIGNMVREVRTTLRKADWEVDSVLVIKKRELTSTARRVVKRGCDVLVVVGGDGAMLRVAPALAKKKVALGIVPAGTGNLLATNLGIPRGLSDAVQTILGGRSRTIDLGRAEVDGKTYDFSIACGIGFDAEVMDTTDSDRKRRWGRLAYLASAAARARQIANVEHQITIDGETITTEAAQVLIANFGRMSLGLRPRRSIEPDDGQLDVIVVRAAGPIDGLLAGWEALRQKNLGESPNGHALRKRARVVRVLTKPARLVEVDGSVVGQTPVEISIVPSALTVLVPAP